MEKDPSYIVAIDMGTSKVVTLVGMRDEDGKISIIAVSCVPASGIVHGGIKNIDQIVRSVHSSIDSINQEWGIRVCEAYVGLSGQHIKCQDHDGYVFIVNQEGEVHEEDVNKLSHSMGNIQLPAGEVIIHILPKSYTLDDDSDISDPVGMIGSKLTGSFKIVTGNKRNMEIVDRSLKRVEVGITDIFLSSLASAEAVLVDDEKELGVAVIDIGGGTCDVCIYHDKTIKYLGVISYGGNDINKDIKQYGVLERHVEKLKVKFGSAMQSLISESQVISLPGINNSVPKEIPQKILAAIIEARMQDIIEKLQDMIAEAGFSRLPGGVVLTGGGAMLADIDKLFAQQLGCDVRIGRPTIYVTDHTAELVSDPKFSTAVGLILRGAEVGIETKTIVTKKPRAVEAAPAVAPVAEREIKHGPTLPKKEIKRPAMQVKDTKAPEKKSLFDKDNVVENEPPQDNPEPQPTKPKGFKFGIKKMSDKVREFFEPNDDIESNNRY